MIVGAAAGAVTALMYAPKPGAEFRHNIQAKAREAGKKAGEAWSDVKDSTSSMARVARERTQQTVGKSKEMLQTYKGRVREAVQSGREAAEHKRKELEAELEEEEKRASEEV
jgi:gas vesicle protein